MDQYSNNWNILRKQAYERDEFECRNCGAQGGPFGGATLVAHHIVPRNVGGNDSISNLATLCEDCHGKIHLHMRKNDNTGLNVPEELDSSSSSSPPNQHKSTESEDRNSKNTSDQYDDTERSIEHGSSESDDETNHTVNVASMFNDTLAQLRDLGGEVTTIELAEEMDDSRINVEDKLQTLEEDGYVHSRNTSKSCLWRVSDE